MSFSLAPTLIVPHGPYLLGSYVGFNSVSDYGPIVHKQILDIEGRNT